MIDAILSDGSLFVYFFAFDSICDNIIVTVIIEVTLLLQFKIAIVVMGRPKYLPDDGDHVLNLDDFQPPHWQGRSRSFDGTFCHWYV